jgi:L-ascorbate 6-phosphate lactonase
MNEHTNVVSAIEAHEVRRGLRLWWLGGPSYAIKSPRTLVYVDPFAAAPLSAHMMATWGFAAERVQVMAPGTTLAVGDVTLTAYLANDWEDEDAVTLMLESGGVGVFIGGDTLYFDGLEEIGRAHAVDLAVLALGRNRRDIIDAQLYADPAEIARAARALRAHKVLPVHWEIWREWVEDPHAVAPHLAGSGTELVILAHGDALELYPRYDG